MDSLEHEKSVKIEYMTLEQLYKNMTDVTYVPNQTIEQIKKLNDEFKEKLQNFKDKYG
jgi:inorganic pyrophosphatase